MWVWNERILILEQSEWEKDDIEKRASTAAYLVVCLFKYQSKKSKASHISNDSTVINTSCHIDTQTSARIFVDYVTYGNGWQNFNKIWCNAAIKTADAFSS